METPEPIKQPDSNSQSLQNFAEPSGPSMEPPEKILHHPKEKRQPDLPRTLWCQTVGISSSLSTWVRIGLNCFATRLRKEKTNLICGVTPWLKQLIYLGQNWQHLALVGNRKRYQLLSHSELIFTEAPRQKTCPVEIGSFSNQQRKIQNNKYLSKWKSNISFQKEKPQDGWLVNRTRLAQEWP